MMIKTETHLMHTFLLTEFHVWNLSVIIKMKRRNIFFNYFILMSLLFKRKIDHRWTMFGCLYCICQLTTNCWIKSYTLIANNKIRNNNMNDSSMPSVKHQFTKHRNVDERNELEFRSSFWKLQKCGRINIPSRYLDLHLPNRNI